MRQTNYYWSKKKCEIKALYDAHGRHDAARILGITPDNFRHICKRCDIDIRERKPYLKRAKQSNIVVNHVVIDKANKLLQMRW